MFDIPVQRVLVRYVREHAPVTYRRELAELRKQYGHRLLGARSLSEVRAIGRAYAQAKAAIVIRLARWISAER